MNELLCVTSLQAGYRQTIVIDGISFTVEAGRITTLIGPNGAGKSTILKSVAGQLAPLSGTIQIEGADLAQIPQQDVAKKRAVMMTGRPFAERLTCRDVINIGRTPHTGRLGILSPHDEEVVQEAMELVGVSDLAERSVGEISDGQRQRVLLARAIVQEPSLMILDEPTSFLDIHHKLEFLAILRKLAREKQIGILLSLHELEFAHRISDEVVCIDRNGKAVKSGPPHEIMKEEIIGPLYEVEMGALAGLYESFLASLRHGKEET